MMHCDILHCCRPFRGRRRQDLPSLRHAAVASVQVSTGDRSSSDNHHARSSDDADDDDDDDGRSIDDDHDDRPASTSTECRHHLSQLVFTQ
jgi:hypothetical protein